MKAPAVPEPEPAKAVGVWIRVSTEDQAKGESPEHHERRGRAYAEARGWTVREVYRLGAVSGKAVREHPETERMMRDIRTGRITGLIFSKLARLARSTRDLLDFSDYFREHDADLISLQEAIDTSTPAGRLFYTMIAAMAQWEREEIADRVAASVPIRAKLGKSLGGAAPFGYRWEGRELVPDPKEAPVRKLLYEFFLAQRRLKAVARLLNAAGHRTRNGSKFTNTTVERLLRDPTAKGVRRANYTKSRGAKKGWDLKPESDWIVTPCLPIVSDELWTQANAILDGHRKAKKPPGKTPVHLFAGLTFCACGERMYVPSNSPKYICKRCRNKIPVDDLEAVFSEELKRFVFSPDDLVRHLAEADETLKEKENVLRILAAERDRIRTTMDRVMKLYLADQLSPDGFGREYRPLETRLHEIEDELPRLQGEVDFLKIQYLSRDEIVTQAQDLYSRWADLSPDTKRQIVETITERIAVDRDEVRIDLCYRPAPVPPPSGPSGPSGELVAKRERNIRGSSPRRAETRPGTRPHRCRAPP